MGSKKGNRTLASRKRHKDMSAAMFENTSLHEDAPNRGNEPLKPGFETALPRKFQLMQKSMRAVADKEAGRAVSRYVPREDLPRATDHKPMGKKAKAAAAAEAAAARGAGSGSSAQDGASMAPLNNAGKKRARSVVEDAAAGDALPVFHEAVQKKAKTFDFAKGAPPKFGATNDAPPTLLVGGNLKKLAQARAGAQKAEQLAQQRAQAIASYAAAKKKRREEEQAASSSSARRSKQ